MIPDIQFQKFPVYALSQSGRLVNFKAMVYPNPVSAKKFTRKKQLVHRSLQAKFFDFLINIDYFGDLGTVIKEMPVIIENSKRPDGLDGLFVLLDYYIPSIRVAVELDSEYHDKKSDKDRLRDKYLLEVHGIRTFRMRDLQLPSVQRKRFIEFRDFLRTLTPKAPVPLIMTNDLYKYLDSRERGS